MGAEDKGFKKSFGDRSDANMDNEEGKVDESTHGWAPDVEPEKKQQASSTAESADAGKE